MDPLLSAKLVALQQFQQKHPTAHVGGSIGLMLRGVDLERDLSMSDLDITIDEFTLSEHDLSDYGKLSDSSDFDLKLTAQLPNHMFVKIDVRVCPEPSFEAIEYQGRVYNVSKLRDILYWKKRYAAKGVQKHADDLFFIETGIRVHHKNSQPESAQTGDLPF